MPVALQAPPFNSETGRTNGAKGNIVRWKNHKPKQKPGPKTPEELLARFSTSRPSLGFFALLRRTQRRMLQQSIAETDVNSMALAVYAAVEVFNMEQRLLGRDILPVKSRSKRSKAVLSPHDLPMPDPVSCGVAPGLPPDASLRGVCGVDTSGPQSASGQAPVAPVDDTPF